MMLKEEFTLGISSIVLIFLLFIAPPLIMGDDYVKFSRYDHVRFD